MNSRIFRALEIFESVLAVIFFAGLFGAITVQVFFRYALETPLTWPSELSVYCYIYIVFIGSAMATRRDNHVVFDMIHRRFGRRAKLITHMATNIFMISILIAVLPSSVSYIRLVGAVRSSALGIPWAAILVSLPIGMAMSGVHLLFWTARHARELISAERP